MDTKREKPSSPEIQASHAKSAAERAEKAASRARRAEVTVANLVKEKASVPGHQVQGFVTFLREQSVVGLAIGLVLGTQAKALVDQLMMSFINPLTGLLLPGEGTLKQKVFTLTLNGKSESFGWGAFISGLLTFFIVAAIVYYVFKGLGLDKLDKKKET